MSVKWCGTREQDQALDSSFATDTQNDLGKFTLAGFLPL